MGKKENEKTEGNFGTSEKGMGHNHHAQQLGSTKICRTTINLWGTVTDHVYQQLRQIKNRVAEILHHPLNRKGRMAANPE